MNWILLFWFLSNPTDLHTLYFKDENACRRAYDSIVEVHDNHADRGALAGVCLSRG